MFESLLWEVKGFFNSTTLGVASNDKYFGARNSSESVRRMRTRRMNLFDIKKNAKILNAIGEDTDCEVLAELVIQAKSEGIPMEDSNITYSKIHESFGVPMDIARAAVVTDKLLAYIKNLNLQEKDLKMIKTIGEVLSQADPETGLPLDADTIAENLNVPLQTVLRIKEIIETFQKENAESIIIVQGNTGDQELEKPFTIDTGEPQTKAQQSRASNNKRKGQQQQKEAPVMAVTAQ